MGNVRIYNDKTYIAITKDEMIKLATYKTPIMVYVIAGEYCIDLQKLPELNELRGEN